MSAKPRAITQPCRRCGVKCTTMDVPNPGVVRGVRFKPPSSPEIQLCIPCSGRAPNGQCDLCLADLISAHVPGCSALADPCGECRARPKRKGNRLCEPCTIAVKSRGNAEEASRAARTRSLGAYRSNADHVRKPAIPRDALPPVDTTSHTPIG